MRIDSWVMRDGTKIKIRNMETNHINNTILMINNRIVELNQKYENMFDTSITLESEMEFNRIEADTRLTIDYLTSCKKEMENELVRRNHSVPMESLDFKS